MPLELRPNCECCDQDIAPDSREAYICTFECTYCLECAAKKLGFVCANCGGELVRRPIRPAEKRETNPASLVRVVRSTPCVPLGGKREESLESRRRAYALQAGEGEMYRFGIDFTVKAGEVQDSSSAAVLEYVTKKGEEPPDHMHRTEDEIFYVLEGTITFRCGAESFDLAKGGFIFLPCGIEHGYTIQGDEPVRLLVITSPVRPGMSGGWGGFVADMENGQGERIALPQ